jgi:hypothetical protein
MHNIVDPGLIGESATLGARLELTNSMEHPTVRTGMPEPASIERTMTRAFLAAHLLTASAEQAENAVADAINSWDSADEDALFSEVLAVAIKDHARPWSASRASWSESFLPAELRPVLDLPPDLRRCFVLRILVGLPEEYCAGLLRLSSRLVDEYTCEALKRLPSLADQSTARVQ